MLKSVTKQKIVNKQFEMIGEKLTYRDIPEDGVIEINKKKMYWWDYYKFRDYEQYMEWRSWSIEQLEKKNFPSPIDVFDKLDMLYGLTYKYNKKQKTLF